MDLTQILTVGGTFSTVILCLAIFVVTYFIRTVVESFWMGAKTNKYWTELALHLLPLVSGVILGIVLPVFPWPAILGTSTANHIIYSLVCGLFSGSVYNRVKFWVQDNLDDKSGA